MTDAPDELPLDVARDLRGRGAEVWVRRVVMLLLAVVPVLALFNVFGQKASQASASSPVVKLTVHSPERVRGGLLYEARFTILARQQIKEATLVLGGGWANGVTINTVEPSPSEETSEDGQLAFSLGSIDAGKSYVLHMQFQVNPTTVGGRRQQVELRDGDLTLVSLVRHLTVMP